MHRIHKIFNSIWPATLWSALILVLLTLPGSVFPSEGLLGVPHLDKVVHIILFGIFVYAWTLYFRTNKKERRFTILVFVLLACAYGIIMEYVQRDYIPHRSFDVGDIMADCMGALLAGAYLFFSRK
jgi:VanZ family protein